MQPDLLAIYPLAKPFIERMLAIDPAYGAQQHQRAFVARLHRMQELKPCAKDHGEHGPSCYPQDVIDQALRDTASV